MAKANLVLLRRVLWGLVVVVGAVASVTYFVSGPPQQAVEDIGGGQYSLIDHTGQPIDQTMFLGHPSLLFFGFTHCPDVCPTTLADMQYWFSELGDAAGDLKGYFVTVDPERDTPEIIAGYVGWVSDRMVGITGAQAEIDKMLAAWYAFGERVELDDGDYTMNHTASVFLVNDQGQFEGTIAYGENSDVALEKIRKLLAKS